MLWTSSRRCPSGRSRPRVSPGDPVSAILDTAREFDVDAIAMSTRGLGGLARAVLGSTATGVLEQSTVPLLLVGPHALHPPVVSVVVLGRGPLSRDVLVPVDYVETLNKDELQLRLTNEELDQLPDFTYSDFVTPPPSTWTSQVAVWTARSWYPSASANRDDIEAYFGHESRTRLGR